MLLKWTKVNPNIIIIIIPKKKKKTNNNKLNLYKTIIIAIIIIFNRISNNLKPNRPSFYLTLILVRLLLLCRGRILPREIISSSMSNLRRKTILIEQMWIFRKIIAKITRIKWIYPNTIIRFKIPQNLLFLGKIFNFFTF